LILKKPTDNMTYKKFLVNYRTFDFHGKGY
jgi:hypothetical protein